MFLRRKPRQVNLLARNEALQDRLLAACAEVSGTSLA